MGTDNLFWKRKSELKRKRDVRSERPAILIVCEGTKTEPNYFKSFRITSMTVEIKGLGAGPVNLVEYACERKKDYEQLWCVFDRDSVPKHRFNEAISKARRNSINIAYSNEAFELWYFLHFDYLTSGISRGQYCKKLNKLIGKKYEKKDEHMYERLLDKQLTAIKNAKRLLRQYAPARPVDDNPSTTVHLLVGELNKYIK